MLSAQLHAREVRSRLWHPLNGRESSEREIISTAEMRRRALAEVAREAASKRAADEASRTAAFAAECEARRHELCAAFVEAHQRTGFRYQRADNGVVIPTFDHIARTVCQFYGESKTHVFSHQRSVNYVRARHVIGYICTEFTGLTLPGIGRLLGGRDHTTILSGNKKMRRRLAEGDEKLTADIAEIKRQIGLT